MGSVENRHTDKLITWQRNSLPKNDPLWLRYLRVLLGALLGDGVESWRLLGAAGCAWCLGCTRHIHPDLTWDISRHRVSDIHGSCWRFRWRVGRHKVHRLCFLLGGFCGWKKNKYLSSIPTCKCNLTICLSYNIYFLSSDFCMIITETGRSDKVSHSLIRTMKWAETKCSHHPFRWHAW